MSPAVVPRYWLAAERVCPWCLHDHAVTATWYCIRCDAALCTMCAVEVEVHRRALCPDCAAEEGATVDKGAVENRTRSPK